MICEANGARVYYEQSGQGKDVLLLHGWGCTTEHFRPIITDLEKDFRITVIDFPGHGKSSRPPEPWGVPEFGECVRQLLDQLQINACHIIAHSFGGRVALYLSSHYPERVEKMVLTGCAGLKKPQTEEQKKRSREYQKKKEALQKMAKWPIVGRIFDNALEKLRQKYGSADYNALDAEMRKTFVKVISQDLQPYLKDVQASTLLIWGEKDLDTPLWMGRQMEKEIRDAGLVVFENDDHFAYLRQWPRFVKVVRAFL